MKTREYGAQRNRLAPLARWLMAAFLVMSTVAAIGAPVLAQDAEEVDGYTYTVEDGDSWDIVAEKTGVDVDALRAANPDAVRETGWLLTGESLTIPLPEEVESQTHSVDTGESWSTIADAYGITVTQLQAANQKSVRPGLVLYVGEKLLIPPVVAEEVEEGAEADEVAPEPAEEAPEPEDASAEEPAEEAEAEEAEPEPEAAAETDSEAVAEAETDAAGGAEPEDAAEAESEAGEEAAEEPAAEEAEAGDAPEAGTEVPAGATEEITPTETITETVIEAEIPDAAGEAEEVVASPMVCPASLADYPDTLVAVLESTEGSADVLSDFVASCAADTEAEVVAADLNGDGVDELVVVYQNPAQESAFVESDLIILSSGEEGYEVAYRARAAGEVRLAATEDVNEDGQADVVWTDTTCGASTCFDTVNVRSWDGDVWADWTDGTITMAYADIELADSDEEGSGQEIALTGGIYGSVGAGPQRSRTEIWSSIDGAPYALAEKTYSASECLYHTVLDANRMLDEATLPEDLEAAKALYEKAATDEGLIKCWVRPAELEELRSFSLFRLALIEAYEGNVDGATDRITELSATYPDGAMAEAAAAWLESFEADGVLTAACDAVTAFAEENPEVWEILADYGYTNPSFEASDVCPPPDVSGEDAEGDSALNGATGASPRSDLGGRTEDQSRADTIAEIAENLPSCPESLVGYEGALPLALAETDGDVEILKRWMHACGALADDRGGVLTADLNGDEADDFVVFPTLISDVGLGPEGAQGAVYIVHSEADGGYALAAAPEVFGKPVPLTIEDLNADGKLDIAWTVEGCSTFCVLETQITSWDGEAYQALIEPGAAIAAGEAAFEQVGGPETATGPALVLRGGVSGTPEGGLTVEHEEIWQSIEGAPFQRIAWEYDRDAAGSNCMGLRLVEADVALQASNVVGYGPAFERYAQALEPGMEACSIFGLHPEVELALLQGLANFRLIQVQALDEDLEGAQASLDFFAEQLADIPYVAAAQQWLAEFVASGDAAKACATIDSFLEQNPDVWQITDHFGYNHPALAAEQICYVP